MPQEIGVSARKLSLAVCAALLCGLASELGSETYQMLTYYPAPYGSYAKFLTTRSTWLARDSGALLVGLSKASESKATIESSGTIKTGGAIVLGDVSDSYKPTGGLRWHSAKLQYSDGTQWSDFASGGGVTYTNVTIDGPATSKTISKTFSSNYSVESCKGKATYVCDGTHSFSCSSTKKTHSTDTFTSTLDCTAAVNGNAVSVSYASGSSYCSSHNNTSYDGNNCGWNVHYDLRSITPVSATVLIQDKQVVEY